MRIVDAQVHRYRVAPSAAVANARTRWTTREGLLLRLFDDAGHVGQGEASPLPHYSTDTLVDCARELDHVVRTTSFDADAVRSPAARFALETALLDLRGQREGRSVASLLGAAPDAQVAVSVLLPADPTHWSDAANDALSRGFRTVKAKVGRDLDAELAALSALDARLSLRLDANGSLDLGALDRLAALHPELVEEPVSGLALAAIESSPVPLAVDESLQTHGLDPFLPAIRRGVIKAVVLKPATLGLSASLALARRAHAEGASVIVTHTFDGPVGHAAACALALALAPMTLPCGLAAHPMLDTWRVPVSSGPMLRASDQPGLGLPLVEPP